MSKINNVVVDNKSHEMGAENSKLRNAILQIKNLDI